MDENEIILAERNTESRKKVSEALSRAGYMVEVSDSATHVFCSVLEKRVPVVLLSGDFDPKFPLPELVRLLRQCNRRLAIILVSEEPPLPIMRNIRGEGIFYHALKPEDPEDVDEIRAAVESAFKNQEFLHQNERRQS